MPKIDTIPYLVRRDKTIEVPPYYQAKAQVHGTPITRGTMEVGEWRLNAPFAARLKFLQDFESLGATRNTYLHLYDDIQKITYAMNIQNFEQMVQYATIDKGYIEDIFTIQRQYGQNSLILFN